MEQHYYSYYEGYDLAGNLLYSGNASFYVKAANAIAADVDNHIQYLLSFTQQQNSNVNRVVIKMLTKL